MSESIQIFIEGDSIPSIDEIIKEESRRKYGVKLENLTINSIKKFHGYWPCRLNNETESGFEFFLSTLEQSDISNFEIEKDELKGKTHFVELSYRDQYEYKCAATLASIFCKLSNGIIFNENNELSITSKNSVKWAKKILRNSICSIKHYEIINVSGRNSALQNELKKLKGKKVIEIVFLGVYAGGIAILFESGYSLFSSAWKYFENKYLLDATKYRTAVENEFEYKKEIKIFSRSSELTIDEEVNLRRHEKEIELACLSDEESIGKLKNKIATWPDRLTISRVNWNEKDKVSIYFNETTGSKIEFIKIGEFQEIKFKTAGKYEYYMH